jgi:hypothetical protein
MIPAFLRPEILPYASVEIVHADGRVEQPMVQACSWCTTVAELVALGRRFPGRVSHSLCDTCAAKFDQVVTS